MNRIKTTDITTGVAMPVKKGTLDHLQSAYREDELDIMQMLASQGDAEVYPLFNTPMIMYGCRYLSGIGAVSQGAIIFKNEIFRTDGAVGITPGFGQVVIGTITTTNLTATDADPVEFSNAATYNVHEIRKITWSAGTSGSGDFDLDDCLLYGQWNYVPYNAGYISSPTGTLTLPGGASDFKVKWNQDGRTVMIDFDLHSMTLATANANYLTLSMPFNANFKSDFHSTCYYVNGAGTPTEGICIARAIGGTSDIRFILTTGAFIVGAGIVVSGQITVELAKADF